MHTCTICEAAESAVEVSPEASKWKIYLCRKCTRTAVAAWANHSGPTWAIAIRQSLQRRDRDGVPQ